MGKGALRLAERILGWKAGVNIVSAGFFCFILTVSPAAAQDPTRVASLTIAGMQHHSESEILEVLHTKAGQSFRTATFQNDLQRLVAWYGEEGFLEASVDSVYSAATPDGLHINVVLVEGKQAVVGSVSFEGNRVFTHAELEAAIETRTGAPFSFVRIESDIQNLLKRYEDAGYSFVKIAVKDIALERGEETRALITLTIEEGKQVLVSEVRVEGNKSTRDFVIVREARLKENEIFRGDMARRVKSRLERLQLFASVSEPELYLTEDGRGGLLVKVSEGNPNSFDGIVGYSPSQRQGEDGFFNGLIDVQFRNILGTGRKLSTRWYRENRISQEIELHYFEPWVASAPVNVGAGFFQRKQDSTYVRTSLDVHTEFMFNDELSMGLSAQQTDVTPTEGFGRSVVPETKNLSFGFSVEYDSRDNPATPTGGVLYRTDYQVGTKRIISAFSTGLPERQSTRRVSLDLHAYTTIAQGQVLSSEIHLRDFRADRVDLADMFRLGGAKTLRGYREGQFL
ncbi:MAG: hypothetical protein HW374_1725, partial [Bacteroidetes bacterium]|nr:hypothetical protein [Bacteroidota bacterium]